jgi:endonuclease-3
MSNAKQKLLQRLGPTLRKDLGVSEPEARPVLESLVYAICRENVSRSQADAAYARLRDTFFDWNEVRVSTAREIADVIIDLPQSFERAERIIKLLQEVFETNYSYDLDGLAKKGLKPAEKLLDRYAGGNAFVTAYVVQNTLGGHAMPVDDGMARLLHRLEVLDAKDTLASAQASLEHLIPKAKGPITFEMLSALAHEFCLEEAPKCKTCPLKDQCPSAGKITSVKRRPITSTPTTVKSAKRQTRGG